MMSDRFWGTLITFCIVAAALVALPAEAGTISLSWNPVTHDDLAGYRLYYGTAAGNYTQSVDVGLVTQATLSGLDDCTTYYIATKAVTGDGTESESYSNVVSGWARPELLSTAPTTIGQSSQGQLVINGHNFQAGATLILSNDAITVTSLTLNSCHQLVADITVAASAALGAVDVTVVNADQVFGAAAGMFSVTADASGPAISSLQAANVGSSSATITWTTDEASDSQLFFRVVGNAAYQQTAVDQSAVTDHSMVLSGLVPGTEYEYYVRSVDGAGNASTAAGSASFTTQTNGFTYLRLEAESVPLTVPLESGSGADAFSGAWVNLADGTSSGNPNNPAGSWDYGFHLSSSDTWHFWFRMHGSSNVENGWLEAVDGAALDYISTSQNGDWEWVGGRSYTLASGLHTLTLGGNEAGARVDRVLVTNDPGFLPSEQPGADVTPPSSAAGLTATASDGAVQLAWTNPGDSDLARVIVRYRTDGRSPQNPLDGYPLADSMATPGAAESLNHTGLTNGATYHYGIFVIDDSDNASAPAAVEATPEAQASPPDAVTGLARTDVMGI